MKPKPFTRCDDTDSDAFWEHYHAVIVPQVHAKLDEVAAKAAAW